MGFGMKFHGPDALAETHWALPILNLLWLLHWNGHHSLLRRLS